MSQSNSLQEEKTALLQKIEKCKENLKNDYPESLKGVEGGIKELALQFLKKYEKRLAEIENLLSAYTAPINHQTQPQATPQRTTEINAEKPGSGKPRITVAETTNYDPRIHDDMVQKSSLFNRQPAPVLPEAEQEKQETEQAAIPFEIVDTKSAGTVVNDGFDEKKTLVENGVTREVLVRKQELSRTIRFQKASGEWETISLATAERRLKHNAKRVASSVKMAKAGTAVMMDHVLNKSVMFDNAVALYRVLRLPVEAIFPNATPQQQEIFKKIRGSLD